MSRPAHEPSTQNLPVDKLPTHTTNPDDRPALLTNTRLYPPRKWSSLVGAPCLINLCGGRRGQAPPALPSKKRQTGHRKTDGQMYEQVNTSLGDA